MWLSVHHFQLAGSSPSNCESEKSYSQGLFPGVKRHATAKAMVPITTPQTTLGELDKTEQKQEQVKSRVASGTFESTSPFQSNQLSSAQLIEGNYLDTWHYPLWLKAV